jgi:hypothetical protein
MKYNDNIFMGSESHTSNTDKVFYETAAIFSKSVFTGEKAISAFALGYSVSDILHL